MITTKTRILSILATVAMLVSMLACFIIPASASDEAAALAFAIEAYKAVLADINEPATNAPNLSALFVGGELVEGKTAADLKAAAEQDAPLIYVAGEEGAEAVSNWIEFDAKNPGENLEKAFPRFAYHEAYAAAGYTKDNGQKNWSITEVADWDAMDALAVAETIDGVYVTEQSGMGMCFKGYNFHLTNDIDFGNVARLPFGARDKRLFEGALYGHGFGFQNVYIKLTATSATYYSNDSGVAGDMVGSVGLFGFLGSAKINDFGIHSGTIETAVSDILGSVSSFGCVYGSPNSQPSFTKVWSAATLKAPANAHFCGLIGTFKNFYKYNKKPIAVNGFIFTGKMLKTEAVTDNSVNLAYGVYGAHKQPACMYFTGSNIIVNTQETTTGVNTFLFGYATGNAAYEKAIESGKIKDAYGVKKAAIPDKADVFSGTEHTHRAVVTEKTYTAGTEASDTAHLFAVSAEELAWKINSSTTNTSAETPVYFLIKDGKISPLGSNKNRIVKYTYDVAEDDDVIKYANSGSAVDVKALFGLTDNIKVTVGETEVPLNEDGTTYNITGDATITVAVAAPCEHTETKAVAIEDVANHTHKIVCAACEEELGTANCTLSAWAANDDANNETGAATHSAACSECSATKTAACSANRVETNNCKVADYYEYTCCGRANVEIPSSISPDHVWGGNWEADAEDDTKEVQGCTNDNCKETHYRYIGTVSAEGISLKPGAEGNIIVTLPANLATADLTFTITGGYSIKNVVGANEEGGVYKATAATVTVTLNAAPATAIGGTFMVEMTNAKATDNAEITNAESAVVDITLDGVNGDADGDNTLTLSDALSALYVAAGKAERSTINVANANAFLADGENFEDYTIDVNDVYEIVERWLKASLDALQ